MFGHGNTRCRNDNRGRRTDIERLRTIAPGATSIQNDWKIGMNADHGAVHGAGGTHQILGRFSSFLCKATKK